MIFLQMKKILFFHFVRKFDHLRFPTTSGRVVVTVVVVCVVDVAGARVVVVPVLAAPQYVYIISRKRNFYKFILSIHDLKTI